VELDYLLEYQQSRKFHSSNLKQTCW